MEGSSDNHSKQTVRIKIISMGNAGVGKSCIIKRYCEKRFVAKHLATIGIDYGVTRVVSRGRDARVNIFDMAGHPVFYEIRNEFYADTQGALLVYDVTNQTSFDALDSWLNEMKRDIGSSADFDNVVFVVCANKVDTSPRNTELGLVNGRVDKKRAVNEIDGKLWADSHGFLYFEVSALTGDGISDLFQALFDNIVTTIENGGQRLLVSTQLGYTREQVDAILRLKHAKDDYQRLGLPYNATSDDINKAFRKLSVLLHPDKSDAPGSEEAFKNLVAARSALLKLTSK